MSTLTDAQKAYQRYLNAQSNAKKRGLVTTQPQKKKKKKKESSLEQAQKAFDKGQKVRSQQKKNKVVTTEAPKKATYTPATFKPKTYTSKPKTSTVTKPTTSPFAKTLQSKVKTETSKMKGYDAKKDLQKAYDTGKNKTYLGSDQEKKTVDLVSPFKKVQETARQTANYYNSKDWKKQKEDLKKANRKGWRDYLSKEYGWTDEQIDEWMSSEEGKALRKDSYTSMKDDVKKEINKQIKKSVDKTYTLDSVNALTKGEFDKMVTASRLGKDLGNKYLGDELAEKIGSKTVESALRSKGATGVMQGLSYADIFSGGVGKYNEGAKTGLEQVKSSGAYNVGYGVGLGAGMAAGGLASRGASVAAKLTKSLPKNVAKEAAEEYAKFTGKQNLKKFTANRVGELIAETPSNVLDAAKMAMDADGNLDKKSFRNWLVINSGLTFGVGGAMEGLGAAVTKKTANETLELLAKQQAGNITQEELEKLTKNIDKLKGKAGDQALSGNIASSGVADVKASAKESRQTKKIKTAKERQAKNLEADKVAYENKQNALLDDIAKGKERPQAELDKLAKAQSEAKKLPSSKQISSKIANAEKRLEELKKMKDDPNVSDASKTIDNSIAEVEHEIETLKKQESTVWMAERSAERQKNLQAQIDAIDKRIEDIKKLKKTASADEMYELNAQESVAAEAKANLEKEAEAITPKEKPKKPSKKVQRLEKDMADYKEEMRVAEEELERLDNEGKAAYARWKNAEAVGSPRAKEFKQEWLAIRQEKKDFRDEFNKWQKELIKAEDEYKTLTETPKTEKPKTSVAKTKDEDLFVVKSGNAKNDQLVKDSAADLDGKPISKPHRAEYDGKESYLNAQTKEKEGLNSIYHKVREAFVDNFDALEHIANHLPKDMRNKMLTQINELRRSQKTGRAIVAEKGLKIYDDAGLRKSGKATTLKRNEYEEYCFLKHELDRRKNDTSFMGKSTREIHERIEELEAKYGKDADGVVAEGRKNPIIAFQEDMVKYFNELLDREVEAGITTAEEAKLFKEKYPNYVPTYREKEFDEILKRRTKDEIDVGRGIKAAKGGKSDPIVPLFNQMQVKTNTVMKRTELNKTLNLLCMASGTTKEELENVAPFFRQMPDEEKPKALLDTQIFTKKENGKYKATMYYNGSPINISIDKDVFDAIRRWTGDDRKLITLSALVDNKVLNTLNGAFKRYITDYSIIFGMKNFKRDIATAMFYTKDLKNYMHNLPRAIAICSMPEKMLKQVVGEEQAKLYKEVMQTYKENGGVISQFISKDNASPTFFEKSNKYNPLKWVENFNSTLETIPRMAEFMSALDSKASKVVKDAAEKGKTLNYDEELRNVMKDKDNIADALYRAKDVTLNFDRSGWLGARLNRGAVPFFNPAIQGLDKLGRTLVRDNIKYGADGKLLVGKGGNKELSFFKDTTAGSFAKMGMALGGMVAFPTWAWNEMFGDYINGEVDGYEKQSDYNRLTNYLLPMGDGKFLKIPKARELASMQALLDFTIDNMKYGSGTTWQKLFGEQPVRNWKNSFKIAAEQIGPVSPFSDNLLSPIWRTYRNETWYGGKIESGADDLIHRENGERYKIWDEKTSAVGKLIGKQFNISPKKVDNILDSYTGIIYDFGISQTSAKNDIQGRFTKEGFGSGIKTVLSSPFSHGFIIDSVFSNAYKSDYYDQVDKRENKMKKLDEDSDEYIKLKAQSNKDKNAFSYTSCEYDELMAQIYLDDSLTPTQKNYYARQLKKGDNIIWNDRRDGRVTASRDPMADAWNMKDKNGKRVLSTEKIIDSCSYTFSNGNNTIKDAYKTYTKNGGKSDQKFMDVTLAARDVQRAAGDSLSSPRWEVVAYSNQLNHIKGSDDVVKSYIPKDSKREHLMNNAKIYDQFGFTLKNYKATRKTTTQGAYDLGYDWESDMRDGERTMLLANARTKRGAKYRDGAYQANDFYILQRMNSGRCLDHDKNGNIKAKDIKKVCDKHNLNPNDDYEWDIPKVAKAVEKEYPDASQEVKAAMVQVITGCKYKDNPYGSVGDYSLDTDTGIYCDGWSNSGYGGYGRRRRRGRGYGGSGGATYKPIVSSGSSGTSAKSTIKTTKLKTTNTSKFKSNLDDAYRRKLKKMREATRK